MEQRCFQKGCGFCFSKGVVYVCLQQCPSSAGQGTFSSHELQAVIYDSFSSRGRDVLLPSARPQLCCAAGWLCEAWISFVHERHQIKAGRRGSSALTFPILHCLRHSMTFTCSSKLTLTNLSVSASVSQVHRALKPRAAFPLMSNPTELLAEMTSTLVWAALIPQNAEH